MKVIATQKRDNIDVLQFWTEAVNGSLTPFSFTANGVSRVEVIAGGAIISSDTTDVTFLAEKLSVKFGKLAISPGKYDVRIVIYTPVALAGIELVGLHRPENIVLIMNAPA